jgi:hypothetical protein
VLDRPNAWTYCPSHPNLYAPSSVSVVQGADLRARKQSADIIHPNRTYNPFYTYHPSHPNLISNVLFEIKNEVHPKRKNHEGSSIVFVSIGVWAAVIGLYCGMAENFSILELGRTADDIMYFESVRDSIFSRDATEQIIMYRKLFEDLRKISFGPKGTHDYLIEIVEKRFV